MKKVQKADGTIHFINEKFIDTLLGEGDVILEDSTIDRTPPQPSAEEVTAYHREKAMRIAREQRDELLQQTDWMMFSDTATPSQAWLDYRQALRDVPSQAGFPDNITWPTKPE